jgi:phosphatidylserine/phosphatidylglycerophosphate/cardiolipin synthase-like enzyme
MILTFNLYGTVWAARLGKGRNSPGSHNKSIIIDEYEVLTGSFNLTMAAEEQNAENLLVIADVSAVGLITCVRLHELPDGWYAPLAHARLALASGLDEARGLPPLRLSRVAP